VLIAHGEAMIEQLFVYGTLGPGRPNQHILEAIGGSWQTATVNGDLRNEGWGSELGYPGIDLNESSGVIEGFLFTSENLSDHWADLDKFEGDAYERVIAKVKLNGKSVVDAYIYTLRPG